MFYYSHVPKKCPPPGGHVFQQTGTIFYHIQVTCIIGTNILTKFHEDWTMNVTSRVLTRKNAPPPSGHVFQQTGTIFTLFHEDGTLNVAPIMTKGDHKGPP
ncbi:hypothetical protein DPMN_186000 [Dreissena polymorpha]|uniref:Uncharacterized protein n=1 Tax=Dreissena polymorpha TaxID=45954 RepID=A0A9D4DKT7_DREPO|nr:hypothetical protein DPMN_186000 [Dreissena polymorpha]